MSIMFNQICLNEEMLPILENFSKYSILKLWFYNMSSSGQIVIKIIFELDHWKLLWIFSLHRVDMPPSELTAVTWYSSPGRQASRTAMRL